MATKNMSRTVIEGGRVSGNKSDRYESNRVYRSQNRDFSYSAKNLIDADDLKAEPVRKKVSKEFGDKLGPLYRWLKKQIGRKWDKVFSELVRKFDTRTVAGRHVVYSHLLSSVTLKVTDVDHLRDTRYFKNDYFVDEHGILQKKPSMSRHHGYTKRKLSINDWAKSRMVMDYGVSLFWMEPERLEWAECGYMFNGRHIPSLSGSVYDHRCGKTHRAATKRIKVGNSRTLLAVEKVGLHVELEIDEHRSSILAPVKIPVYYRDVEIRQCQQGRGVFRQGARFSQADREMWDSLNSREKYTLLVVKPDMP